MIEKTNASLKALHPYKSPKTTVIFVKMQSILCISNPEKYSTETEEGDNNW